MDLNALQHRVLPVGHLPLIRGLIDRLGFKEVIDRYLPRHPLAKVSDAECVVAMILNVLSGRQSIWRIDQWLEKIDLELLMGAGVEGAFFNDTRLGGALDRLDEIGTDRILGDIVTAFLASRDAEQALTVHMDTTSVSLYGDYEDAPSPSPTFGFSKDKRPDLRQLIFGLALHGSMGIPMAMSVNSGNTPDQTSNRDLLAKLTTLLPDPREVTVVADCKLVDADTVGQVLGAGFHLVSLVPKSFGLRGELVRKAWEDMPASDDWPILAERPPERKDEAVRLYRGRSYERAMRVHLGRDENGAPTVSEETMRFVVVWSDQLAERFDAALEDKLAREAETLAKTHSRLLAAGFACEADARKAAERAIKPLEHHLAEVTVRSEVRTLKRPQRGRPRKDDVAPTEVVWFADIALQRDDEAINAARREASCFVLITDWLSDTWTDQRVLNEYRHQHIIEGHTGFRWLKGPAAVAPVHLNNPKRIRAFGLVLILALMVRNYLQATMRSAARARGVGVMHPFRKKADLKLTTEMAMEWFGAVWVAFVSLDGETWRRTTPTLRAEAKDVLTLLGLREDLFARPPPR
jgi:transposase